MNWEDVKIGQWCLFSYLKQSGCLAIAQIDDFCYEQGELRMIVMGAEIWNSNGKPDGEEYLFNPYEAKIKLMKIFNEKPKEFLI